MQESLLLKMTFALQEEEENHLGEKSCALSHRIV